MINLKIDNLPVQAPEGTSILDAAKSVGVYLPTLCHLENVNNTGACRVCLAEIEGVNKLVTACNTPVSEGMSVLTNSPRARRARMTNMQLMLSQHNMNCATCIQDTNCALQKVAHELGIISMPFQQRIPPGKWDMSLPLIRDNEKCIKCMRCIQMCKKIQGLGVWGLNGTGSRTCVDVSQGRSFAESDCSLCGMCISVCPTSALSVRYDTLKAFRALAEQDKISVIQIAPAVYETWDDIHGIPSGKMSAGKLVSALKKIGFNYVYDMSFTSDLTIMEESGRFIRMFMNRRSHAIKEENGEYVRTFTETRSREFPLITSACPAAVRYIKSHYPEFTSNLSTAKSPQQTFGVLTKTHIAQALGVDPSKIFCVSAAPCAAKKAERSIPGMDSTGLGPDVDLVLTPGELARMIASEHVQPSSLSEEPYDIPPEVVSGSGVTIGSVGGYMEASLRTVYYNMTGKFADFDAFSQVKTRNGWREASFDIAGTRIHVAVASGLKNVAKLIDAIKKGSAAYDYIEVMACPGGCSGIADTSGDAKLGLYGSGKNSALSFMLDNPSGSAIYEKLSNSDMVQKMQDMLNTDHSAWVVPPPAKNKQT